MCRCLVDISFFACVRACHPVGGNEAAISAGTVNVAIQPLSVSRCSQRSVEVCAGRHIRPFGGDYSPSSADYGFRCSVVFRRDSAVNA
jgi:hypothetical protein